MYINVKMELECPSSDSTLVAQSSSAVVELSWLNRTALKSCCAHSFTRNTCSCTAMCNCCAKLISAQIFLHKNQKKPKISGKNTNDSKKT